MEGYDYSPGEERRGGGALPPRVKPASMQQPDAGGVVPTLARLLFEHVAAARANQPGLRVKCRCSFVQIYKVRAQIPLTLSLSQSL